MFFIPVTFSYLQLTNAEHSEYIYTLSNIHPLSNFTCLQFVIAVAKVLEVSASFIISYVEKVREGGQSLTFGPMYAPPSRVDLP